MTRKYFIIVWAALMMFPAPWLRADDPADGAPPPMPEPVDVEEADEPLVDFSESYDDFIDNPNLAFEDVPYSPILAVRLGGWGVAHDGSPVKVGEWQDVESGVQVDVDGLFSNGCRTFDFFATGNDNETTAAGLYFYGGPLLTADIEFDRFIHRLDHDPFANYPPFPGVTGEQFMAEDLNLREDYAIRVQEFKADFKGRISENVRWELNFWGMRKSGERQANAVAHCYDHPSPAVAPGRFCHVLSQRQQIDWLTMKVEPVLAAKFGRVSVKYSRPMRVLTTDDQAVFRNYNAFPPQLGSFLFPTQDFQYAQVPENFTQTDRLQIGWDINSCNDAYARVYHGNTQNKFRDLDRKFWGYDLRITNRAIQGVTIEGHAKKSEQENQFPPFLILGEPLSPNDPVTAYGSIVRHPINYDRERYGMKATWRPYQSFGYAPRSLRLTGGYDYNVLERQFAVFETVAGPHVEIDQRRTVTHDTYVRAALRTHDTLDTFIRYRTRFNDDPLYGFRETNGDVNSNLPVHEDLIEIGSTWSPADNFVADVRFGIENRFHHSTIAYFDEDNYPITATLWWAPTCQWSLSAGYGYYTNWIDQTIQLGDEYSDPDDPNDPLDPRVEDWAFAGSSHVFSLGANYAPNECWRFVGSILYTQSDNTTGSLDPTTPFPELPTLSNVSVNTTRLTAGVDYLIAQRTTCYFRYNLFDYDDRSAPTLGNFGGTLHMVLGGITATF